MEPANPPADAAPQNNPPAPTPTPTPTPAPPAATVVNNGDQTEDAAQLKSKLDEESRLRRDREQRINELEDENRRLKTPPTPAPRAKRAGWTLLHEAVD